MKESMKDLSRRLDSKIINESMPISLNYFEKEKFDYPFSLIYE
jgi:hypothetical protein